MNESEIRQGAVDETYETLCAVLEGFGFTQSCSAIVENSSLYGRRAENADRLYLGRLHDPDIAQGWVNDWFEKNGPNLPE